MLADDIPYYFRNHELVYAEYRSEVSQYYEVHLIHGDMFIAEVVKGKSIHPIERQDDIIVLFRRDTKDVKSIFPRSDRLIMYDEKIVELALGYGYNKINMLTFNGSDELVFIDGENGCTADKNSDQIIATLLYNPIKTSINDLKIFCDRLSAYINDMQWHILMFFRFSSKENNVSEIHFYTCLDGFAQYEVDTKEKVMIHIRNCYERGYAEEIKRPAYLDEIDIYEEYKKDVMKYSSLEKEFLNTDAKHVKPSSCFVVKPFSFTCEEIFVDSIGKSYVCINNEIDCISLCSKNAIAGYNYFQTEKEALEFIEKEKVLYKQKIDNKIKDLEECLLLFNEPVKSL